MTYFWLVPNTKHEQRDVDWTWSWCARLGQRPSFADDYLKEVLLSCRNRISIWVKLAWLFLFQVWLPLSPPICPNNPPATQAGYVHQQQAFSSTAHWAQWSVQGTFLLRMSLKSAAATLGTFCYPPVMCFWNECKPHLIRMYPASSLHCKFKNLIKSWLPFDSCYPQSMSIWQVWIKTKFQFRRVWSCSGHVFEDVSWLLLSPPNHTLK